MRSIIDIMTPICLILSSLLLIFYVSMLNKEKMKVVMAEETVKELQLKLDIYEQFKHHVKYTICEAEGDTEYGEPITGD